MHNRKRRDYGPHLEELEMQQQISYRPLIWSTWGREHPETSVILSSMAKMAARRRGLRDFRPLLWKVRAGIGIQLIRRSVRMLRSCLADPLENDVLLLDDSALRVAHDRDDIV